MFYSTGETYHLRERSYTHVYKYTEENPTGPKRKLSETLEQMKTALTSNSTVSDLNNSIECNANTSYLHCSSAM